MLTSDQSMACTVEGFLPAVLKPPSGAQPHRFLLGSLNVSGKKLAPLEFHWERGLCLC